LTFSVCGFNGLPMSELSSLQEAQSEIVQEFSLFDDWQDKYAHLIEIGRAMPRMNPVLKTDDRKVKGCQSQVWLASSLKDGRLVFEAESDALIVQGLIALLLRVYSNRTPSEIAGASTAFLGQIGLDRHLSQNRANGLNSMIREIHRHARETSA
jgi:cysteine desulfuration protein SufE